MSEGKADSVEETPFEIARREAFEEIGLPNDNRKLPHPMQVEHICELPTNLALTELGVVPCVALLHAGDDPTDPEENLIPRLDAKEVSAVFSAPFHQFLSEYHDKQTQMAQGPKWYKGHWSSWYDGSWRMHYFYIPRSVKSGTLSPEPYKVFGMTARILVDAARIAYAEEPAFEYNSGVGDEHMLRKLLETGRFSVERKPGSQISRQDVAKISKI
ncbi:Peroxisomal coenzyme A diphosphatase nudt7 [Trapelia coarctata]|nr:Peroxisomal coenzyme A diphosphatase nudt7 [Trapelia coarctata]